MSYLKKIFYSFLCLSCINIYSIQNVSNEGSSTRPISGGYTDITVFKDDFIVVGTDGRIDRILKSGEKVRLDSSSNSKFNCIFSNNEILLAAGDHGTMLYSLDGKSFMRTTTGIENNINGIASRNSLIIAGADNGIMLVSTDGKLWHNWPTGAQGNIISVSANPSYFFGISDSGEIIKSTDGITWDIKDYNKEYAGYNEFSNFKKILATPTSIMIIGTHNDGSPSILFSNMGNVWAERIPLYHDDQGISRYLSQKPNGLTYDPDRDQFVLSCDGGEAFLLPSCTKCNKFVKIAENNLNAVVYYYHCLIFVGDDFSFHFKQLQ